MPNEKLYTEQQLIQLAADGDSMAFTQLYNLYSDKLFSFCHRITSSTELSQDIVQSVFLKLWKDKTQLRTIENFNAYVYRMARNQALNAFKRMANETIILTNLQKSKDAHQLTPEENLQYKEAEHLVKTIVKELPPKQNLVYKLSHEQGLNHTEIAGLLKISPFSVKNHLAVALRTIRKYLSTYRNKEMMLLLVFISLFP